MDGIPMDGWNVTLDQTVYMCKKILLYTTDISQHSYLGLKNVLT